MGKGVLKCPDQFKGVLICVQCTSPPDDDEDDDGVGGGEGSREELTLSDVLVGAASEDSTFQQLAQNRDLLEGLEFPVDTLSQLPATPPRVTPLLSPPPTVSDTLI